jgi:hypothetical protein
MALVLGALTNCVVAWVHAYRNAWLSVWPAPPQRSAYGSTDCYEMWQVEACVHNGALRIASHWQDPDASVSGSYWSDYLAPDPVKMIPKWARFAIPNCASHNSMYHVIGVASGWPFLSMWGGETQCAPPFDAPHRTSHFAIALSSAAPRLPGQPISFPAPHSRLVPLAPIWPGFLWNTFLYTGILLAIASALYAPFAIRRHHRMKSARCLTCGYPIGASTCCTECGAPLATPGNPSVA